MNRIASSAAGLALLAIAGTAPAQDSWYPSPYGKDDVIGAANNLSPEATKAAAGLVRTGKVYRLGIVTDRKTPAYGARSFNIVITQSNDGTGSTLGSNDVTANDDLLLSYLGIGTQIDGLGHVGIKHRYYNGNQAKDFVQPTGLQKLGTENIPAIATRGILLDMAKLKRANPVAPGTAFNMAEIDAAAKAAGITIRKGDVVIFHTGYLAVADKDPARFLQMQPGLGKEGAAYLASLGVVAVGADTFGLEVIPFENKNEVFPVHQILLAKHGVYILENINTVELAKDGATEFFFVLGPARFKGAVQMTINPIAIR